jgi:hypothetical protein
MEDIALRIVPPKIDSPLEAQGKVLQLRQMMQADQMAKMQMQQHQQQMMDDASYRAAIQANPGGGEALEADLASRGNYKGHAAAQKQRMDARKGKADIDKTESETKENSRKTAENQFEMAGQIVGSWAYNPAVTKQQIVSGLNAALFSGVISPEVARAKLTEIEKQPEDPRALNAWANNTLTQITKAKDQWSLTTVDANTKANNDQSNTNNIRSAAVQREGQNKVDARAKQFNDITAEATNSQIVETPQGFQVVNKGTANARPVAGFDRQPILGKESSVAKNAQMADRLVGMIPLAKQLLKGGATASGAGALADQAMAFTGYTTTGADAATALETVSGWMTSNVPRFEGPQSDKDTATYRTMAGLVGDRTQPMSTRLKALEVLEALMQPYSGVRTSPFSGPPGTAPAAPVAPRPAVPQTYRRPAAGATPATQPQAAAPAEAPPPLDSFFK